MDENLGVGGEVGADFDIGSAVGERAGVEDGAGWIGEGALLGDVEVAAEVEAGSDGAEEVEETALPAGATGGCAVGDAKRAAVGKEDVEGRVAVLGGEVRRPDRDVFVGDVVGLAVAFGPDAGDACEGEAAEVDRFAGGEEDGRAVAVMEGGKDAEVVVVAEDGSGRGEGEDGLPGFDRDLTGVAPVADAEESVGAAVFEEAQEGFGYSRTRKPERCGGASETTTDGAEGSE